MKRIFNNFGWKMLSLAIAIALWFGLVGEQELTTSVSAAVVFRNIPSNLEISSDVPDRIHLEVRGPVGTLSTLKDPVVVIDLEPVSRPGEQTFQIQQSNLNLPSGVVLSRAIPAQLRLRFERKISREIGIQLRLAGSPPSGYRIVSQQLEPPTVRIVGPESRVTQVENAETDPVDLSAVVSESQFRVHTYVSDPQVRIEGPSDVTVKVVLEKIPEPEGNQHQ